MMRITHGRLQKDDYWFNYPKTKQAEKYVLLPLVLVALLCMQACKKAGAKNEEVVTEIKSKPFITGARIAWDFSTLTQVSDPSSPNGYNGYGRIKQLNDKSLLAIYESGGNVMVRKSADNGKTWGSTLLVAEKTDGTNMTVPDLLELKDGTLLAMYNPRPFNIDPSRKFGIRIKRSTDKGLSWRDEQLLYEAGYQFENGCWEPAAIQLPNGEIQLFFANEGPYTSSNEQNISLLRSMDNGITWTKNAEVVSFRAGKRDGMPVPVLLQGKSSIVLAIEDNAVNTFKPYTIRNTFAENWANTVTGTHPNRHYALANKIPDEILGGAPYLAQLKTGETILSFQGTEGRANNMDFAEMKVAVGNEDAKDFGRITVPFSIASNKSALWSSLTVLDDHSIIAVTSTNQFSASNRTEVWMMRGYLVPEIKAEKASWEVDGNVDETGSPKPMPLFVGHKTNSRVNAVFAYDDNHFYIRYMVKDAQLVNGSAFNNSDGLSIYLDPQNKSFEKPHTGNFCIATTANNKVQFKQGKNGIWQNATAEVTIKVVSKTSADGYVQEMAIPWLVLGGKPALNSRIGLNLRLSELKGAFDTQISEDASGCNADEPFTWMTLLLQ